MAMKYPEVELVLVAGEGEDAPRASGRFLGGDGWDENADRIAREVWGKPAKVISVRSITSELNTEDAEEPAMTVCLEVELEG